MERANGKRVKAQKKAEARLTPQSRRMRVDESAHEKTPLHYACEKGQLKVVHELLLSGAAVASVDGTGSTPLHLACASGHVRVVQRLLSNSSYPLVSNKGYVAPRLAPPINVADKQGRTPLHQAAAAGHHTVVGLCLEAGANAEVLDHALKTALDVCTSPLAFDLLRSRAEIYNRRERLEGIILKKNLVESASQGPYRSLIKNEVEGLHVSSLLGGQVSTPLTARPWPLL